MKKKKQSDDVVENEFEYLLVDLLSETPRLPVRSQSLCSHVEERQRSRRCRT